MAKAKLSPEERLAKTVEGQAAMEAELHLLLPAKLWPFVEALCRLLLTNDGKKESRDLVANLALTCRLEAQAKFGHDTLETFALARMLREGTGRWHPKQPQVDALTRINNAPHKNQRLTGDQETAANDIREVWQAFGKFLEISGRGIGGGGSARSAALGPVDVMGEPMWRHHQSVFKPWQAKASRTVVSRRTSTGQHLTVAAVVFKVLVEDIYPESLDTTYAMVKGTALRALKAGLTAYHNPDLLDGWGKPRPNPSNAPQTGGQGGQTAPGGAQVPAEGAPAAPAPAQKRPPGLWQPPRPKLAPGQKIKLAPRKPR